MNTDQVYRWFAGVDIAAQTAAVVDGSSLQSLGTSWTIDQTPSGWQHLQQRLLESGVVAADILVVLEASGSYWMQLALNLYQAGFAVSVINPLQARHFARALLKRAKTDALDARLLAQLAATLQPARWSPPPAIYDELQQRLSERDALLDMIQQQRNRLHALQQRPTVIKAVYQRMERHIHFMEKQLASIAEEIATALKQDDDWAAAAELLLSISGIGLITAAWLLTATVNFTCAETPEQIVAYAGLAPQPFDSGSSVHGRASIGHSGHTRLRTALYMASLSATRHNPIIRTFYDRLRAAGKAPKVARCAAARKLLCLAWAVVTKRRPFDPHFHSAPLSEALIA